jgi:hypothetical protein
VSQQAFQVKKREYLKGKSNELAKNSKIKNIRYLHRGINELKRGYQPRSNLVKDENGDLVTLKLNETHRLLVYADHVNLLCDNINTIKKNSETLTDASKEVGLETHRKLNTCCCLDTRMQGKIMTQFRYLGTTRTNQSLI